MNEISKRILGLIDSMYKMNGHGLPDDNINTIIPLYKNRFNEEISHDEVLIAINELLSYDLIEKISFPIDLVQSLNNKQKISSDCFFVIKEI